MTLAPTDNTTASMPTRHPRQLTAAELHVELEKEQEAIVNRLTRELSLLRTHHNASVVSNTSSGHSAAGDPPLAPDSQPLLSGSGFSIPSSTGRQHHRTYSNTSQRSQTANIGSGTTSVVGITAPAPIRPQAPNLSRQNSTASRRSRNNSPGPHSLPHSYTHSHLADPALASYFQQRAPPPHAVPGATPSSASEFSPGILPGTSRYEETAFHRTELEAVKRENEALKRRIRELERTVRERRASDASRGRSESVSTTASMSIPAGGGGGMAIAGRRDGGGRDRVVSTLSLASSLDEVRVGESAASAGLRGQEGASSGAAGGTAGGAPSGT